MKLPKDLARFRRNQILKRVLPCIGLLTFLSIILLLWGEIIFRTDNKAFQGSCYTLVLLIPFVATGVPFRLIDSTYCGTVKRVDIVTSADHDFSQSIRGKTYVKNTVHLTIETPNGKTIYKTAPGGKTKPRQISDAFHEGDHVFHLYGTNTVTVFPSPDETQVFCTVCCTSNNRENTVCRHCAHSLVKNFSDFLTKTE